jgi:hypothetical protein
VKEDHYMFEKEIELAPPASDRKANFQIAKGICDAIDRLTAVMTGVDPEETIITPEGDPDRSHRASRYTRLDVKETEKVVPVPRTAKKAKKAKEEPFPHIDTTTDEGPTENTTDLTAAVDATVKDNKDE